jgi:hypothetical protein
MLETQVCMNSWDRLRARVIPRENSTQRIIGYMQCRKCIQIVELLSVRMLIERKRLTVVDRRLTLVQNELLDVWRALGTKLRIVYLRQVSLPRKLGSFALSRLKRRQGRTQYQRLLQVVQCCFAKAALLNAWPNTKTSTTQVERTEEGSLSQVTPSSQQLINRGFGRKPWKGGRKASVQAQHLSLGAAWRVIRSSLSWVQRACAWLLDSVQLWNDWLSIDRVNLGYLQNIRSRHESTKQALKSILITLKLVEANAGRSFTTSTAHVSNSRLSTNTRYHTTMTKVNEPLNLL